jgi:hypothetical protein
MLTLYLTIWTGLTLFVVGETGRALATRGSSPPQWAWWAFASGLAFTVIHIVLAFDIVHDWTHDDAVRSTAMQTEVVFGVSVGWGVYVNYAFLAAWLADAVWWRTRTPGARRSTALTWTLRAFYLTMLVNGAIVFAEGPRRIAGSVLVAWLCVCWGRNVRLSTNRDASLERA